MLTLALVLATTTAAADVTPADYPELAPGALLPPILSELKRTLADPYSIRDFVICPARGIKMKAGKPTGWNVLIAFNAKNSYGGYAGLKTYSVVFRNGQIRGGILAAQFATSEGIEGLVNSMIARRTVNCPPVSDDDIQRMLSAPASIAKPVN